MSSPAFKWNMYISYGCVVSEPNFSSAFILKCGLSSSGMNEWMNVKFRLGSFHFFLLHYKIQCNYLFLSNLVILLFIVGIATVLYSSEVYHQVFFKVKILTQSPWNSVVESSLLWEAEAGGWIGEAITDESCPLKPY